MSIQAMLKEGIIVLIVHMSEYAERIRQIRGSDSRAKFSEQTGISPRALINYETGKTLPNIDVAAAICRAYGISPLWLMFGEGSMFGRESKDTAPQRGVVINIDPAVQLVNEALEETGMKLNDVQKKAIVDIVREELLSKTKKIAQAIHGG